MNKFKNKRNKYVKKIFVSPWATFEHFNSCQVI